MGYRQAGIFSGAFSILSVGALAAPQAVPSFKRVVVVIFENTAYDKALAQPFLGGLTREGALLTNFSAEAHPSQPNYIALVAGTMAGLTSNGRVNLGIRHLGDLLEDAGKTWRVYAQAYPGRCFLGASSKTYVRKHEPFVSFRNVQDNPARCANIVDDSGFANDVAAGRLPDFSLFIPDMNNDGHDNKVAYADGWLSSYFGPLLKTPAFAKDTLFVVTFDEDDGRAGNHIYTALYGDSVVPGSVSKEPYNHYSLLRTIELALGLGSLGQNDDSASAISGIWR